MAFPQKQQFVFKHFTIVFLSVLPTHFMHRLFTWSLVVRCLQNHPHSWLDPRIFRSDTYVVRYRRKVFAWGEMYSYSFTSRKTYLVIQTWRIVKWATTWQNQQSDCPPSLIRVLLSAWRKLGSLATHSAHSEDSDQTGWIWSVFAGRTLILLVLSCRGSNGSDIPAMSTAFLLHCSTLVLQFLEDVVGSCPSVTQLFNTG